MLDPVFNYVISFGLALLLVTSGIGKLEQRQEFAQLLSGYRLMPSGLLPLAAVVIALAEITLAFALVLILLVPQFQIDLVVTAVAALFSLYCAAIFINIRRGNLSLDCGCQFGESGQSISMALVYRNLFIVGATLLLNFPTVDRSLGVYDYAAVAFGVSLALLFYITVDRLIANATRYREIL